MSATDFAKRNIIQYSSLAQSVERMTVNHDVAGSSPAGGANEKPEAIASGFFVGSFCLTPINNIMTTIHVLFLGCAKRSR